jgi:hypothetical protein
MRLYCLFKHEVPTAKRAQINFTDFKYVIPLSLILNTLYISYFIFQYVQFYFRNSVAYKTEKIAFMIR